MCGRIDASPGAEATRMGDDQGDVNVRLLAGVVNVSAKPGGRFGPPETEPGPPWVGRGRAGAPRMSS